MNYDVAGMLASDHFHIRVEAQELLREKRRSGLFGLFRKKQEEPVAQFDRLLSIAINQHYPEIEGGYYDNKGLIVLLLEILKLNGLSCVIPEYFQPEGFFPAEVWGLERNENYLLIDKAGNIAGYLRVEENYGSCDAFEADRKVVRISIDEAGCAGLMVAIQEAVPEEHRTLHSPGA